MGPSRGNGLRLIFPLPRRGATHFNLFVSVLPPLSSLTRDELLQLVGQLLDEVAGLKRVVAEQREARAQVIRYRRERWVTPEGQAILATLRSANSASQSGIISVIGSEHRTTSRYPICQTSSADNTPELFSPDFCPS